MPHIITVGEINLSTNRHHQRMGHELTVNLVHHIAVFGTRRHPFNQQYRVGQRQAVGVGHPYLRRHGVTGPTELPGQQQRK